jgi:hypothetical protein
MDLASQADVADRLGRDLTDIEVRKAGALLSDATALILDRFPWYATAPTQTSKSVCCAMVMRVLQNPEGKRSETIDDYSYTIDSARSAGELYMTENEVDSLTPVSRAAFSIVPTAPPWCVTP